MIPRVAFDAAKGIARHFYGRENTEQGITDGLTDLLHRMKTIGTWDGSALAKAEAALLKDRGDQLAQGTVSNWSFIGMWGAMGCPVIRFDKAWAASVCVTSIPPELFGLMVPPWDYFMLDVPAELGLVMSLSQKKMKIAYVKANYLRGTLRRAADGQLTDGWFLNVGSESGDESPRGMRLRADQLFGGIECDESTPADCHESMQMIGPLVAAACMAFLNGEESKIKARPLHGKHKRRRGGMYPTAQEYVVGKPVRVDLSAHVREFISSGGRGGLKTQGVVRGHWKNQRCGPGGAERKFIHIEPYWRGPEDAPIAVRSHVLKGGKNDGEAGAA